jgi:hypothetical protein
MRQGQPPTGEAVNGGTYAPVIRADDPPASRPQRAPAPPRRPEPSRPSGPHVAPGMPRRRVAERDAGPSPRSPGDQQPRGHEQARPELPQRAGQPAASVPPESGSPALTHADPGTPGGSPEVPVAEPDAYGPDDPAYGPPSAAWYAGEEQRQRQEQEQASQPAPAELQEARGPFEPLQHPDGSDQRLISYLSAGYEPSSAKPIDQIKDFYLHAEAVDPEHLDGHIEQLLERQRQLISEYFKEAGVLEDPQ